MPTIKTLVIAFGALCALASTSCSGGTSAATCATGRTVECACTSGAMGAQTCTAAGIYTPCSCSPKSTTSASGTVAGDSPPPVDRDPPPRVAKSKTTEARELLAKLYAGARAYYLDRDFDRTSATPIPPQFPATSVGPTPPLGECCAQGGQCAPGAQRWENDTWTALQFSVDDPHYYSYSYITDDAYTAFTVRANGDLDCDGEYSTFEMLGIINSIYADGPARDAALAYVRELE